MKEFLVLLLAFLFFGINQSYAYDLVLPREKRSVVYSNYALFIGKAKNGEEIIINDDKVTIASNGAFAHSIKLKDGENRVVVRSNYNTQIYKLTKVTSTSHAKPEFYHFEPKKYVVKSDNTPLRSTPIDYGMNRISHLFKDTPLILDGTQGEFYRVKLSKNQNAWIAKSAVKEAECECFSPEFIEMNCEKFKNASVHTIAFTEKLPYTVEENDKEILFKVYNPFVSEDSVYTMNIKKPEKYSYKITLDEGKYVFKLSYLIKENDSTLEGLNIVVDAGHGGSECGAIGCLGDKEKDINLLIALELKEILTQMGANVFMTRECDANVSLSDRVKFAQDNCADIFLSIHLNSIPDIKMDIHKNRGTSVYYYNPNSKGLAEHVLHSVTSGISTHNDRVRTASFAVIRPTDYLGILVETAYMTNPLDSVMYKSESFPRNAASAIANGICSYVNKN